MRITLESLFLMIVFAVIIMLLLLSWAFTPLVVRDFVSGRCLEVISPREGDTCYNLPQRYDTEWRFN